MKVTHRILDDDEMDQDVETEEQEEKEEQEVETVRVKKEFPESTEGEESGDGDVDEETIAERKMRKKMSQADKQKKGGNARVKGKGKGKGKGKSSVVVDPPMQTRRSRRHEPSQSTNETKAVEEDLPSASQQRDVANQEASLNVWSPAGTQVPSVEDAPVNSETLLGDGEDIYMKGTRWRATASSILIWTSQRLPTIVSLHPPFRRPRRKLWSPAKVSQRPLLA